MSVVEAESTGDEAPAEEPAWLHVSTENCSVQAVLDIVGAKWSLLVIRELFNGVRRFDDIRRHTGMSEAVLTRRLRELAAAGILERRKYQDPGSRPRHDYRLTPAGFDLFPVIIGLLNWGDKHISGEEGGSWMVRHRHCGTGVVAAVTCPDHGSAVLDHRDTLTSPGPAAIARKA